MISVIQRVIKQNSKNEYIDAVCYLFFFILSPDFDFSVSSFSLMISGAFQDYDKNILKFNLIVLSSAYFSSSLRVNNA